MFLSPERFDGFRIAKDTTDIGDRERVNQFVGYFPVPRAAVVEGKRGALSCLLCSCLSILAEFGLEIRVRWSQRSN